MSGETPGLQLDRRMAKLLGYQITTDGGTFEVDPTADVIGSTWSPSTRIADAWEIVEHMRGEGCMPSLSVEADGRWFLAWTKLATGESGIGPYADTAPLAICRAALLAMA